MEQGLPYFEKFVETYPTVSDLANADEKEVLRLWQGLGYYSRARNLHATAKHVSEVFGGIFPNMYKEILKLKGVGPYTAAAIASICFDEPTPVVDGNVFRFASRYFGIKDDIAKQKTRIVFEEVLIKHISKEQPGIFNQAMMEFGSTVCTPSPDCPSCIFNVDCFASIRKIQNQLPSKSKKIKVRERFLNYLVLHDGSNYLMRQRDSNDVWAHLFDFKVIEGKLDREEIFNKARELLTHDFVIEDESQEFQHILSHQRIKAIFYKIKLAPDQIKKVKSDFGEPYSVEEIVNLPKPKLIVNYLEQIGIKS